MTLTKEHAVAVTPPTQLRLTAEDRAHIAIIRERFGLKSITSAVQFSLRATRYEIDTSRPPKKSRKKSEQGA